MATKLVERTEPAKLLDATMDPAQAGPGPAIAHSDVPNAEQLDSSAESLLKLLDERDAFLIQQTCEQQQLRPWMYVVGILKRALDTGDHTLPSVDPMWRTWGAWTTKVIPDAVCPICNVTFTPRWQGQLYDTNTCGATASRAELAARDTSDRFIPTPVGEEAPEQCKSTVGRSDERGVPTIDEALADAEQALSAALSQQAPSGGLVKTATMDGNVR